MRFNQEVKKWATDLHIFLHKAEQLLAQCNSPEEFVVKVFDGEDIQDYYMRVKKHFATVKRLRPKATRNTSVEFFMLGLDFQKESVAKN